MRKLIVNADDFGFNYEITDGIIQCHENKCVTSTTLMVNMPGAEYAAECAKKLPNLSVGIHFVLDFGIPISTPNSIPKLANTNGTFRSTLEIVNSAKYFKLPIDQIETEFCAQVEKMLSLGITPTHCDSHHNITVYPQPCIAMMRVARKYDIKRLRTYRGLYTFDKTNGWSLTGVVKATRINVQRSFKLLYYELLHRYWQLRGYKLPDVKHGFYKVIAASPLKYDLAGWCTFLNSLSKGITELTIHPGLPSDDPMDSYEYKQKRVSEYKLFNNPQTREMCVEKGVELINFCDL